MDPAVQRGDDGRPSGLIGRLRDKTATTGVTGTVTAALNRLLVKGASLDVVHVLLLNTDQVLADPMDESFEMRFLTSDEVRGYAAQPGTGLVPELATRVDGGLDFCFAVLNDGRLASYCWLALRSVEPEHSASVALGLPNHMAYLYKAFTLPEFRGRRLYGAATAAAAEQLSGMGITQVVAFVYWNNASALQACERMGYRRLGLLITRPSGPLRVPRAARDSGIRFGADAEPLLAMRLMGRANHRGPRTVRRREHT